ncbi:hypothetical protein M752DRAFT_218613 [Aspergillus phoenicis ATCC 13157]|uniref:Contig An13c0010, genomic contig n=3 Tax=Aspergillus TaxID=5052 RepID=A2R170_ASPNC|nr:uncharacterized protein An13g00180 [Aspergillus niger]RDK40482.1 hypothetical protein M752DRAFT_218613 [Aspergillus phoenicis ATCC 13157]CAK46420.1 unnamed protein product [Aspergillus niger]
MIAETDEESAYSKTFTSWVGALPGWSMHDGSAKLAEEACLVITQLKAVGEVLERSILGNISHIRRASTMDYWAFAGEGNVWFPLELGILSTRKRVFYTSDTTPI